MSLVYTQHLHIAGQCQNCGPTMVSRQGMQGFAPATWHCDICAEDGAIPELPLVESIVEFFRRLDHRIANLWFEIRLGRCSRYSFIRWLCQS